MITPSDLIHLTYTPDLSEGGCAYACRRLADSYRVPGHSSAQQLRQIVGEVALELALRRYLSEQNVPFAVLGQQPFTRPEHFDVALGGHRCDGISYLITRRKQITELRHDMGKLLQAPALVPMADYAAEGQRPDDLYLFAFLLGLEANGWKELHKALGAGQPAYLVHALPKQWAQPSAWIPLGELALKSECEGTIQVEIGGQDRERNFITASLELVCRQRQTVKVDFYSLAYVHIGSSPEARIGIHCSRRGDPLLIHPHEWDNLWLYGLEIILAGWLTHAEYRQKASVLNAGHPTFQYNATPVKNLQVPLEQLNPLGILLEKVKKWDSEKRQIKSPG